MRSSNPLLNEVPVKNYYNVCNLDFKLRDLKSKQVSFCEFFTVIS